jgi:hypothetical protein
MRTQTATLPEGHICWSDLSTQQITYLDGKPNPYTHVAQDEFHDLLVEVTKDDSICPQCFTTPLSFQATEAWEMKGDMEYDGFSYCSTCLWHEEI